MEKREEGREKERGAQHKTKLRSSSLTLSSLSLFRFRFLHPHTPRIEQKPPCSLEDDMALTSGWREQRRTLKAKGEKEEWKMEKSDRNEGAQARSKGR